MSQPSNPHLTGPQRTGTGGGWLGRLSKVEGVPIAFVFCLLVLLFCFVAPRAFLGYRLYMSFAASVPPPMIIALGLTLVVVAGEMDLSFPSIVAFSSYIFSMLFQTYGLTWPALAAALAAGTTLGLINGLIITQLGIPSLIATHSARTRSDPPVPASRRAYCSTSRTNSPRSRTFVSSSAASASVKRALPRRWSPARRWP